VASKSLFSRIIVTCLLRSITLDALKLATCSSTSIDSIQKIETSPRERAGAQPGSLEIPGGIGTMPSIPCQPASLV
jgi:hypothetical protein